MLSTDATFVVDCGHETSTLSQRKRNKSMLNPCASYDEIHLTEKRKKKKHIILSLHNDREIERKNQH